MRFPVCSWFSGRLWIDRRDTGEPVVVLRRDNRYSSDRITTLYEYTVRQANPKDRVFFVIDGVS